MTSLSAFQARVLAAVSATQGRTGAGGMTIATDAQVVASHLGTSTSSVARALNSLTEKGLVLSIGLIPGLTVTGYVPVPKAPEFPDTEEGARALISEAMSEEAATALLARLDRGTAALVPDSAVTGVWGLIDTNYQARIVLYLIDGDFEADENWVDEVIRTHAL